MNNIIIKGLGLVQKLITFGYSYVIEVVTPDDKIVYKGSGHGGGPVEDFKFAVDTAIKTNSIRLKDPNFRIQLNVYLKEDPSLEISAKLRRIVFENKQIDLRITIIKGE